MKKREDTIPSPEKPRLTKALERLVKLYEAWGKNEKVMKWRNELETAKVALLGAVMKRTTPPSTTRQEYCDPDNGDRSMNLTIPHHQGD